MSVEDKGEAHVTLGILSLGVMAYDIVNLNGPSAALFLVFGVVCIFRGFLLDGH